MACCRSTPGLLTDARGAGAWTVSSLPTSARSPAVRTDFEDEDEQQDRCDSQREQQRPGATEPVAEGEEHHASVAVGHRTICGAGRHYDRALTRWLKPMPSLARTHSPATHPTQ